MRRTRNRVFSREFKEAAVLRMVAAGQTIQALADELELRPKLLYHWRNQYERDGVDGFRESGRPRARPPGVERAPQARPPTETLRRRRPRPRPGPDADPAAARIADLERTVGRQALALDFFAHAWRHIKASPQPTAGRGTTASSP